MKLSVQWWRIVITYCVWPLSCSRQHYEIDDCLEDNGEDY